MLQYKGYNGSWDADSLPVDAFYGFNDVSSASYKGLPSGCQGSGFLINATYYGSYKIQILFTQGAAIGGTGKGIWFRIAGANSWTQLA